MGFTCNTFILRTPTGILKIVEIVLVLVCLLFLRFGGGDFYGNRGGIYWIGDHGDLFLASGTFVGYAIIVPSVLLTYLLGATISILELFINLVGAILFIVVGALFIAEDPDTTGMIIAIVSIVAGAVFLVDFCIAIKNTTFTVTHTTVTQRTTRTI